MIIKCISGAEYKLEGESIEESVISIGGMGVIIKVYDVETEKPYVAKIYHPVKEGENRMRDHIKHLLERNISKELESVEASGKIKVLVPLDYFDTTLNGKETFGCIMEYADTKKMISMDRIAYSNHIYDLVSVKELTEISSGICDVIDAFDKAGLYLSDFGGHSFFYNRKTGCLYVFGADDIMTIDEEPILLGMPGFIAPELLRKESNPGINSEKWALASVLFYIWTNGYAVLGDYNDRRDSAKFENPVFVFDPEDKSNRPDEDGIVALRWNDMLSVELKKAFLTAFTEGIDPEKRLSAEDWKVVFENVSKDICVCEKCGGYRFTSANNCYVCDKTV